MQRETPTSDTPKSRAPVRRDMDVRVADLFSAAERLT
jgi:hypothetical protein